MMAIWGNARANAYTLCFYQAFDNRYWGANIHWPTRSDMSQRERERLIHRKYILKEFISKSNTWELEMRKQFPLNKDELAVLKCIDLRNNKERKLQETSPLETEQPEIKSPKRNQLEVKRQSRELSSTRKPAGKEK